MKKHTRDTHDVVVVVYWTDCTLEEGLVHPAVAVNLKPLTAVSYGLLVSEDKDTITITTDEFSDGRYRNVQTFYKPQVQRVLRFPIDVRKSK